jgi:hypothetical protein
MLPRLFFLDSFSFLFLLQRKLQDINPAAANVIKHRVTVLKKFPVPFSRFLQSLQQSFLCPDPEPISLLCGVVSPLSFMQLTTISLPHSHTRLYSPDFRSSPCISLFSA